MEMSALPAKTAYSVAEIAEATTLSEAYLRGQIRRGHLPVRRFGRRVLVLATELRAYLERGSEGEKRQDDDQRAA